MMRVCSGSGCLRAIPDDQRFCDECKPASVSDGLRQHTLSDRERFAFLYSGKRWQTVRVQAIKACPICARCGLSISEIADHIVPSGIAIEQAQASGLWPLDKYAGFYFKTNLQGLCRPCHYIKTTEDKTHTGAWPDVVAKQLAAPRKVYSF